MKSPSPPPPEYIDELVAHQSQLYAYIMASLCSAADSADVLQLTNIVLWENHWKYDRDRPFAGWAITSARYQILSFLKARNREPLIFDTDIVTGMQLLAETEIESINPRKEALKVCMTKLKDEHRMMLSARYAHRKSIAMIAEACDRSIDGVKSLLKRLRKSLGHCIELELQKSKPFQP